MNISELYTYHNVKSGVQRININQFVADSLLHIVGHYFAQWSTNFVLITNCYTPIICVFYDDLLMRMFSKWGEWPLQIINVQKQKQQRIQGTRRYTIMLVDSYESFRETNISSYVATNDYNEFYYIILQQRDAMLPREMKNIFEYCWRHSLINCVIQIQTAKGEIFLYTYFPFMENNCNNVDVVMVNQYNGSSLVHKELFHKKARNFHGCPLKVASWNLPPFMYLLNSNNSKNTVEMIGGIEGRLLMEISAYMNFTLVIETPSEERGVIYKNRTATGALKLLQDHEVDISIGGFRQTSPRSQVATATVNYYQSTFSLVAVEEIYLLTSMETLLYPFDTCLWILILCVVIFAMGMAAALQKVVKRKLSHNGPMDIVLMSLGMSPIYQPKRAVGRILNVTWMIYALLIRTTYHALLFHMIRTHITTDVPQTIEELPARGYTLVMSILTSGVIQSIPTFKFFKKLLLNVLSDFKTLEFLESLPLKEAKKYIGVAPIEFIQHYITHNRREGAFRIFPYTVMSFEFCMYLQKHSYLINQFNEMLTWIQSSGLIDCWSRQVLGTGGYALTKPKHTDRLFGLAQLEVAFVALACCHVVATLVFVAELLYKRVCCRCKRFGKKILNEN